MRRKQLLWRCRRGMKELDALLVGYIETQTEIEFERDVALFEAFLNSSDEQLWRSLVLGQPHQEALFEPLIQKILSTSNNPIKKD